MTNKKTRGKVYNKYKGRCAYCGIKFENNFTIDHIIPKKRGCPGINESDSVNNLNPCCYSCNSSKGVLSIEK